MSSFERRDDCHSSAAERRGEIAPNRRRHEDATCFNLSGRGLVVISSCGHAGVINAVRAAYVTISGAHAGARQDCERHGVVYPRFRRTVMPRRVSSAGNSVARSSATGFVPESAEKARS